MEYIYKGKVINLKIEKVSKEGKTKKTEIIEHKGAVVMLPIDEKENIIFIKQYRRAIKKTIIELPAGTLEKNEDPKICAARELQEEIGYKPNTLVSIGDFYTTPGFCTEVIKIFIAKDLEKSPLKKDLDEEITPFFLSFKKAEDMIKKNEIKDGKTIVTFFLYKALKHEIF
jgi:ADP-ribose pyrophosphatase